MRKFLLWTTGIVFFISVLLAGKSRALNYIKKAQMALEAGHTSQAISLLENAIMEIRNSLPLTIKNIRLCNSIRGYGDFDSKPDNVIRQGEPFLLYFEVENPGIARKDGKYILWLTEDARLLNEKGKVLLEKKNWTSLKGKFATSSIPVYFSNRITGIPKGNYTFEITINDRIKRTFVVKEYKFKVE